MKGKRGRVTEHGRQRQAGLPPGGGWRRRGEGNGDGGDGEEEWREPGGRL